MPFTHYLIILRTRCFRIVMNYNRFQKFRTYAYLFHHAQCNLMPAVVTICAEFQGTTSGNVSCIKNFMATYEEL